MNFIVKAWTDGTDFIGTDSYRPAGQPAGRTGLGDMICEVSNLYAQTDSANVLLPKVPRTLKEFLPLIDKDHSKYVWQRSELFHKFVSESNDTESLSRVSNRKHLSCYPEYDYVQLDKNKFIPTDITSGEYATIQRIPLAKKCQYTAPMIKNIESRYNIPLVDIGGREDLGLAKLAYIIDNAKFHVGIDSGMSHFALTIKDKKEVHIYVPKNKITGVAYRWINNGYNVTLIEPIEGEVI